MGPTWTTNVEIIHFMSNKKIWGSIVVVYCSSRQITDIILQIGSILYSKCWYSLIFSNRHAFRGRHNIAFFLWSLRWRKWLRRPIRINKEILWSPRRTKSSSRGVEHNWRQLRRCKSSFEYQLNLYSTNMLASYLLNNSDKI